ncbi:hypothetical protein [Nostoc sp. T09]|uniref:hypothetical protein n=1 Tax=Nostoc sp. T09 TaxID=1932621 RepID=UPI0015C51898|nr:hypothetical protein [Nostoc sp. T09]
MKLLVDKISSEIGTIVIVSDGEKLCSLDFVDYEQRMLKLLQRRYRSLNFHNVKNPQGFSSRIQAYFEGDVLRKAASLRQRSANASTH